MKKLLFIFGILTILNISCKKENKVTTYTIKGKVVQSCTDDTPIAGLQLFLKAEYKSSNLLGSCNENKSVTTDNDGNFSITYTDDDVCGTDVFISYSDDPRTASISLMGGVPLFRNTGIMGSKIFR